MSNGKSNKPRVPLLASLTDIKAAKQMTEEEKIFAAQNTVKYPPNATWDLFNYDPEYSAITLMWGGAIFELMGDASGIPGGPIWLICLEVARHYESEPLAANMVNMSIKMGEMRDFHMHQVGMVAFPDSEVWTEEQSMTLKFTRALLEKKMTDELFERALKLWGEQVILRRIGIMAWAQVFAWSYEAFNFNYDPKAEAKYDGQPTPQEGMQFQQWFRDNLKNQVDFFKASKPFGKEVEIKDGEYAA